MKGDEIMDEVRNSSLSMYNMRAITIRGIEKDLEEDLTQIYNTISSTVRLGIHKGSVDVYNLHQRYILMETLHHRGFTCEILPDNGVGSSFVNGMKISWREETDQNEETKDDIQAVP